MLLVVEPDRYAEAAGVLREANSSAADAATNLLRALVHGHGIAGEGTGPRIWSACYDDAARRLARRIGLLVEALGNTALLVQASGANHAGADEAMPPSRPTASTRDVHVPALPTVYGGQHGVPHHWDRYAAHLDGLTWPGADTHALWTLVDAWAQAATRLGDLDGLPAQAAGLVEPTRSPEIPYVTEVCTRLGQRIADAADDCLTLASGIRDYADALTQAHADLDNLISAGDAGADLDHVTDRMTDRLRALDAELPGLSPQTRYGGDTGWLAAVATAGLVIAAFDVLPATLPALDTHRVTAAMLRDWERTTNSHTIRKHVGRTDAQLAERLRAQPTINAASTFATVDQAVRCINRVLARHDDEVTRWLESGSNKPKRLTLTTEPIGRVAHRDGSITPGVKVITLLVRDSTTPLGYRVQTAYLARKGAK